MTTTQRTACNVCDHKYDSVRNECPECRTRRENYDGDVESQFCVHCHAFTHYSVPVNTGHATTGESGCPDCLNASLRPVVAEKGDERTIWGGYIAPQHRESALTVAEAILKL